MTVLEEHRQIWKGKSDEWLFERLQNELKMKIDVIHDLLKQNEELLKIIENTKKEDNGK